MKFLSIDIETTGLNESYCQILEFAAVVGDFDNFDQEPKFEQVFFKPIYWSQIIGEPFALKMNADIIARIPKYESGEHICIDKLAVQFEIWINEIFDEKEIISVAGKNFNGFDRRFLNKVRFWNWNKFHHRVFDPGSLYFNPKADLVIPSTEKCIERSGISWDSRKLHNAVDDAKLVIHLLRRGYSYDRGRKGQEI